MELQSFAALTALVLLAACPASSAYREVHIDEQPVTTDAAQPGPVERGRVLRVSVAAMQSPRDTFAGYSPLLQRFGELLGVTVELIQRRTYAEVYEMLRSGQLDMAFICTGTLIKLQRSAPGLVEIAGIPVINGRNTYQSFIIVPEHSTAVDLEGLKGARFAFTDELSLSGHAYPTYWLTQAGHAPATYFAGTLFTRSHDRSIHAVARGLVDAAAVDSLIYQQLIYYNPGLARVTKVVHRSPLLGMPPVVVATALPENTRARIRQVLLDFFLDPQARKALDTLHIDRFVDADPGLYDSAAVVVGALP